MCQDVVLRIDRQCFSRHAPVTNEVVYEMISLFIFLVFFFLVVTLTNILLAFFAFPPLLADVALLGLRP